jgi:hypothetical protein
MGGECAIMCDVIFEAGNDLAAGTGHTSQEESVNDGSGEAEQPYVHRRRPFR